MQKCGGYDRGGEKNKSPEERILLRVHIIVTAEMTSLSSQEYPHTGRRNLVLGKRGKMVNDAHQPSGHATHADRELHLYLVFFTD